MLQVQVIGRLGADAMTNAVGDRVAINFSVAADIGKDKNGNKLTRWVKCVIWRDSGKDAIAAYLKKGTQVYLDGLPDARAWQGQNDIQANIEIIVYKVKLLSTDQQQPSSVQKPASPIEDAGNDQFQAEGDLPF